jgi:curved DNA-binding protein CbpA
MKNWFQYEFYSILGLDGQENTCGFDEIKKAYYKKAKLCHPDLHDGDKQKEEEFKILVLAFDVLSDPDKRKLYNLRKFSGTTQGTDIVETVENSIMDSSADDTLEELIVGNNIPENVTLATLFLDMTNTDIFIRFREGKNMYREKKYAAALRLFEDADAHSPSNILYKYFLARTYASLGDFSSAATQYRAGIEIGEKRIPPQKLIKLRRELDFVKNKKNPLLQRFFSLFGGKNPSETFFDAQNDMISDMNLAIRHIEKKRLAGKTENEEKKRLLFF